MYSDEWSVREFIGACMGWVSGKIAGSRYKCDPITACCTVLRKLGRIVNNFSECMHLRWVKCFGWY